MDVFSYWKYKCDELKERIHDLLGSQKYITIPRQLTVSFKCKKNDLTELITQIITENAFLISLIIPIVKQFHTKTSLHDVYEGLEENINITAELDKSLDDITLNTILKYTSVLTSNMIKCMNVKESLRMCLDKQNQKINYISWNCERYVNHLQVLISLLSSAEMKPLVLCKSEPTILTIRPRQVLKAIQNRPYQGNQDYDENKPQSSNYTLRESTSETPRSSHNDLRISDNYNY